MQGTNTQNEKLLQKTLNKKLVKDRWAGGPADYMQEKKA